MKNVIRMLIVISLLLLVGVLFAQPIITSNIVPQYLQGVTGTNINRLPVAYFATISGLTPNATYRYYNTVVVSSDGATGNGAGNAIYYNPAGFVRTASVGLSTAGTYGTFTASASGTYSGWFITEPTANATRFVPGIFVRFRVMLNDGNNGTAIANRVTTLDSARVVNLTTSANASSGTGLLGFSNAASKHFVLVYDHTAGTGRPISATFSESDGTANTTANSYASYYANNADGTAGAYGCVIPNLLANGVRRVELRDASSAILANNQSATGVWPSSTNTVNPTGGVVPVILSVTDTPLEAVVIVPPSVNSISRPIQNPSPNTAFAIQANITDVEVGMTAYVKYYVNGGGEQNVSMSLLSGNTYQGFIPGQADGSLIAYHVEANNPTTATARFPSSGEHYVRIYGSVLTDATIIINEFRYSSSPDWVEIYNKTGNPINLSYWKLWDDAQRNYTFLFGTILPANGYLVFTENIASFNSTYPNFTGNLYSIAMPYSFNFSGDQIRLFDVNDNLVDGVTYVNVSPWPASPAGTSLELNSPVSDNSNPANWIVSGVGGGTPGAVNSTFFYVNPQAVNNPNPPQDPWTPSFPNDPMTANQPPVAISFPSQTGAFSNPSSVSVTYETTRPPLATDLQLPPANTIQRFWSIEATGGSFENATLVLNFTSADLPAGITDPITANPPIGSGYTTNNGQTWNHVPLTNITDNGTYYSATITGLNHFSEWGLGNGGLLPVELSSFTANAGNGFVQLFWRTESEINNQSFRIFRSLDRNVLGELIAVVPGSSNSTTTKNYRYTDQTVQNGITYYYRLMDVSFDGSTVLHHQIVTATPTEQVTPEIPYVYSLKQNYPNPFNPSTTIEYSIKESGMVSLSVFDLNGREVAKVVNEIKSAGNYQVSFNAESLPAGIYFYRLETEEFTTNKKMLLVK